MLNEEIMVDITIKLTSNHMLDYDLFLLIMIASNLELFDIFPNPLLTKLFYVLGRNNMFANSQYAQI